MSLEQPLTITPQNPVQPSQPVVPPKASSDSLFPISELAAQTVEPTQPVTPAVIEPVSPVVAAPTQVPPPVLPGTPPAGSPPPAYPPMRPKGMSTGQKMLLAVLALIVILGAGGYLAYSYFFNSPEKIMQQAMVKFATAKSWEYDGTVTAEFTESLYSSSGVMRELPEEIDTPQNMTLTVEYAGSSDITDTSNPKGTLDITTSMTGASESMSASFKTIYLDKILYIKILQMPALGEFFSISSDKWIKIDYEELSQGLPPGAVVETPGVPTLSEAEMERIQQIWIDRPIIKVAGTLADEVINEQNSYHYAIMIDEVALKQNILEMYPIATQQQFSAEETQEFEQSLDEMLAAFEFTPGEIWVGKRDKNVRKISLGLKSKQQNSYDVDGSIMFESTFSNFNVPMNIVAPDDVATLEEVMESMWGGFGSPGGSLNEPTDEEMMMLYEPTFSE